MYVRRWNVLCHYINNFSEWCSHSIFTYLNYIPYDCVVRENSTIIFFFRIFNRKNAAYWGKNTIFAALRISLSFNLCIFNMRYTDFFIKFFIFSWLFESWLIFIYRSETIASVSRIIFFFLSSCLYYPTFTFFLRWKQDELK